MLNPGKNLVGVFFHIFQVPEIKSNAQWVIT